MTSPDPIVVERASGHFLTRQEAIDACVRRQLPRGLSPDFARAQIAVLFARSLRPLTDAERRRVCP